MDAQKQTITLAKILGVLFIIIGFPKVIGFEMMVANFNNWNLGSLWRYIVGTTEVVLGVLMFVPILRKYAAFLYFSMMPAAFMIHLASKEYGMLIMPVIIGSFTLWYLIKDEVVNLSEQ